MKFDILNYGFGGKSHSLVPLWWGHEDSNLGKESRISIIISIIYTKIKYILYASINFSLYSTLRRVYLQKIIETVIGFLLKTANLGLKIYAQCVEFIRIYTYKRGVVFEN